mmetsp:Transcript_6855/g.7586  ORF Transcript_6855/g.7586 Transcript_6855/m.7586 type:complete len:110 (+) Transcript_6855:21-350(+)
MEFSRNEFSMSRDDLCKQKIEIAQQLAQLRLKYVRNGIQTGELKVKMHDVRGLAGRVQTENDFTLKQLQNRIRRNGQKCQQLRADLSIIERTSKHFDNMVKLWNCFDAE